MAYATLAELQDRVTANAANAAVLTGALAAATQAVDTYTHRNFDLAASATARVFSPTRADRVSVDDIATETGLIVKVGRAGAFTTTLTLPTDFWLKPSNALGQGWPYEWVYTMGSLVVASYPTVEVTAKWGWPAVPAEVKEATLLMASRLYSRKDFPTGVAGFGDYGVVRVTAADTDVARLLDPFYRIATS